MNGSFPDLPTSATVLVSTTLGTSTTSLAAAGPGKAEGGWATGPLLEASGTLTSMAACPCSGDVKLCAACVICNSLKAGGTSSGDVPVGGDGRCTGRAGCAGRSASAASVLHGAVVTVAASAPDGDLAAHGASCCKTIQQRLWLSLLVWPRLQQIRWG